MSLVKNRDFYLFIVFYIILKWWIVNAFSISSSLYPYKDYMYILNLFVLLLLVISFPSIRTYIGKNINFQVLKDKNTYLYLILFFLMILFFRFVIFNLGWLTGKEAIFFYQYGLSQEIPSLLYIIGVVILAPITEEIFYRGILFSWLQNKIRVVPAMIIVSILFGLFHIDYIFFGIMMGLAFNLIYYLKHSLTVSIILHMLWNFYIFVLV